MKNTSTIIISLLFLSLSCKAQSPIIDIEKKPSSFEKPQKNAYYKDINNFYNDFEGTWIATEGNKVLKIELKKLTAIPNDIPYYSDYIVGEYQYIENGVEKTNTLNNLDQYNKGLSGGYLLKSHYVPTCKDCDPQKRRLRIPFFDRSRDLNGIFTFQLIKLNGKKALKGLLIGSSGASYDIDSPPPFLEMTVPSGYWTFIKQ